MRYPIKYFTRARILIFSYKIMHGQPLCKSMYYHICQKIMHYPVKYLTRAIITYVTRACAIRYYTRACAIQLHTLQEDALSNYTGENPNQSAYSSHFKCPTVFGPFGLCGLFGLFGRFGLFGLFGSLGLFTIWPIWSMWPIWSLWPYLVYLA